MEKFAVGLADDLFIVQPIKSPEPIVHEKEATPRIFQRNETVGAIDDRAHAAVAEPELLLVTKRFGIVKEDQDRADDESLFIEARNNPQLVNRRTDFGDRFGADDRLEWLT